jgi:hypothetical protein
MHLGLHDLTLAQFLPLLRTFASDGKANARATAQSHPRDFIAISRSFVMSGWCVRALVEQLVAFEVDSHYWSELGNVDTEKSFLRVAIRTSAVFAFLL